MASNFQTLDDLPLLSKADIAQRFKALGGRAGQARRPDLMRQDIAKWLGCSPTLIKRVGSGKMVCSERVQLNATKFYALWDAGKIELVVSGRTRAVVRSDPNRPKPLPPVKKPRIDFAGASPRVVFS